MPSTARSLPVTLLRSTLLVIAAVLTTGTAATVIVAGDSARRTPREAASGRLDLAPFRRRSAMRALLDSVIAPLGNPPPLDSAALRRVVALTRTADRAEPNAENGSVWIAARAEAATSGVEAQQSLRAWARSAPLPALWGYTTGLGGVQLPWELPVRSWPALQRFVRLSEAEADSALLVGDADMAMLRARETIAAARHFVDQPTMLDAMIGRSLVQHGARLLDRAARQAEQPVAASQALRLATMAREGASVSHATVLQLRALGIDLRDGRLLAIAQDRTLAPSLRLAAVDAGFVGVCLRARELLVGADADRRTGLEALAAAVADVPRANELTPLLLHALDAFEKNGLRDDRVVQRARMAGGWPALSPWLVPPIVQQRAAVCRAL